MSPVAGKRILILEDEFLLALEAADALRELGADVIGPAHTLDAAAQLLNAAYPDAALLDVNIRGSSSKDIAGRLQAGGVPFILATGYGAQNDVAGSVAVIDKPYDRRQLQSAVSGLFQRHPGLEESRRK